MAVTNGLALPIPELTDTADGPDAISDLANAVEDYVFDRILPTGVGRYVPHYWGVVTSLPTATMGAKVGDICYHSGLVSMMRCITPGNTVPTNIWRQAEVPIVASGDTTAGLYVDQLRIHPTYGLQRWDGTTWVAGAGSPKPSLLPLIGGGVWLHYTNSAGGYENVYLTQTGRECKIRGLMRVAGNVAVNDKYTIVAAGGIPTTARPTGNVFRTVQCFSGLSAVPERCEVLPDGSVSIGNFSRAYTATWLASWDISWNVEGQPTT